MVHGDNKGLKLPPRAAPIQIIIVPIPKKGREDAIFAKAAEIEKELSHAGFRVEIDKREETPGWKYNYWEFRGIPFRIEVGDGDLTAGTAVICRRDTGAKEKVAFGELCTHFPILINAMHKNLYDTAKQQKLERTKTATTFASFIGFLNEKNVVLVPFCCTGPCEDKIKLRSKEESVALQSDEESGLTGAAKSLCIPFDQPELVPGTKCFGECGGDAKQWCFFGRSY